MGGSKGCDDAGAAHRLHEVSATELTRRTAELVRAAERGERVVIRRRRRPVALMISIELGIEVVLPRLEELTRRHAEAVEQLHAGEALELRQVVPWWPTPR